MSKHPRMASMVAAAFWFVLSTLSAPTWAQTGPAVPSGRSPQAGIQDVALSPGGVFVARVLDRSGMALAGSSVTMSDATRRVAAVVTGPDGSFRIRGVPNGTYTVSVAGGHHVYRLWNGGSEPSRATRLALIVADDAVVRGQCPPQDMGMGYVRGPRPVSHSLYDMIEEHPVLAYTALTAAIVVPIVVINQED